MKMSPTIVAVLAALSAAPTLADDDCFVPMADWQPREAVARMAAENGWTVRRIKIDDGCYEIDGRDAQGRRVEVTALEAELPDDLLATAHLEEPEQQEVIAVGRAERLGRMGELVLHCPVRP